MRGYSVCAISGDVFLESMPILSPRVGPFLIETSVKKKEIKINVEYEGITEAGISEGISLLCEIRDDGKLVKEFKSPVLAGAKKSIISAKWDNPILWEIGKTKLYTLTIAIIKGDKVIDRSLPEKFGFREFEIRGKHFYLNNVKINLRPFVAFWVGRLSCITHDSIERWFLKTIKEGHNFVYTESVDVPNQSESIKPFLNIADEVGMLTAITPVEINKFWKRLNEPVVEKWYEEKLKQRAQRVWNHPSLVLYRMNMNFCAYNQDQNPLLLDGAIMPKEDLILGKQFAATEKSSKIMESIDSTRKTWHHACGNTANIYTLNNYLCWPELQDVREWLYVWHEKGNKPLMMCEFALPYPGSFSMNDRANLHSNEPLIPEYGAILLGERSYAMEEDDYLDFVELAYNRETKIGIIMLNTDISVLHFH